MSGPHWSGASQLSLRRSHAALAAALASPCSGAGPGATVFCCMRTESGSLLAPYSSARIWLKVSLVVSGALAGTVFGLALTKLGKVIAGAPQATLENYLWNAAVFGALAGLVSPLVSWWLLRRVPLWRTVAEPLAYAVAGGVMAILVGVGALILILPPAGLVFGFLRLRHRYPEPRPRLPSPHDGEG